MIRSVILGRSVTRLCQQVIKIREPFRLPDQFVSITSTHCSTKADENSEDVKNEKYFKRLVRDREFSTEESNNDNGLVFGEKESDELPVDEGTAEVVLSVKDSDEVSSFDNDAGDSQVPDFAKDVNVDLKELRPVLKQAGNLAAYVNESETLQKLVRMGVDLHAIENKKERDAADLLLQLDFETDIKPRLLWLHSLGVPNKGLGKVITNNPMILGESIESMKDRVGYLEAKNFSAESIGRILYKAPKFLTMDVKEADGKLGFYQKEFKLTGPEVRAATTRLPKLITFPISTAKWSKFTLREFLGFSEAEAKAMFIAQPKVLLSDKNRLMEVFDYLYHTMKITHTQIAKWPQIFRTRLPIIKQRHAFLETIGRAQYDPTKENYVSLHMIVGNDVKFCKETAKRPLSDFNNFLKSR